MAAREFRGIEGAMLKRAHPHADMHINSNIILGMDEKARHRSNNMQKHGEQFLQMSSPAGK